MIVLESSGLRAEIVECGAELIRLQDADGRDFIWKGDSEWWASHAPLLFPIVGRMPNDTIEVDGRSYPMSQHGFARGSNFTIQRFDKHSCMLRLVANDETRKRYPFEFKLDIEHEISPLALLTRATVYNDSERPMPFSFGFHPALQWPLPYGGGRDAHRVSFDSGESADVWRTIDGLIQVEAEPSPLRDNTLPLDDHLFDGGVMIFKDLRSRGLNYGVPGRQGLRVEFPYCPDLGIWTKLGAPFVCIEPWQGYAAPKGFSGELAEKPGILSIAAGASARFEMRIGLQLV